MHVWAYKSPSVAKRQLNQSNQRLSCSHASMFVSSRQMESNVHVVDCCKNVIFKITMSLNVHSLKLYCFVLELSHNTDSDLCPKQTIRIKSLVSLLIISIFVCLFLITSLVYQGEVMLLCPGSFCTLFCSWHFRTLSSALSLSNPPLLSCDWSRWHWIAWSPAPSFCDWPRCCQSRCSSASLSYYF